MFRALLAALALLFLAPPTARAAGDAPPWIDVEVGQSYVFKVDRAIARVLISDPEVAEIKLLEQGQVQIRGVTTGSTDLWIWYVDDTANPVSYELTVHRDLADLIRRVDGFVDGTPPRIYPLLDRIVVEGPVSDVETLERIADVARVYDEDFVNLMTVTGDHQIQLDVVFAEVNRTALRELGLNGIFGTGSAAGSIAGPDSISSSLVNVPAEIEQGGNLVENAAQYVNSGYATAPGAGTFNLVGVILDPINLGAILSVLEQNSISKVLARPSLTALSGQQAEFLAGGEVPIPVAQTGSRISLEFKEYGVKLIFVPTVLGGDVVDMRVYIEVSDIDSSNSIRLTGIEIPGFLSRKSQSHLRIQSGKTFAMAGMLHETVRSTVMKVPVLGDIPIVGALFRSVNHRRDETELMIFVTPHLVRPMAPEEVPAPPGTTEDYNPNDFELFLMGFDHRPNSRTEEPTGPIGLAR